MYTMTRINPNAAWFDPEAFGHEEVFWTAATVVSNHRPWFRRQRNKYLLHPIVVAAMKLCEPRMWSQLLLEWPHRSDNDPNMVAFTRDERAGEADRVVTTSMGKYLVRHFALPDHYVRDLVALHTIGTEQMKLVHTTAEMIYHIQNGPQSCMRWEHADPNDHAYQVYNPKYGWHMAVRIEADGMTCGRALCYEDKSAGVKFFVRSYCRNREGGYSHADNKLEAWLKSQGYEHRHSWLDCHMAYITRIGHPFLAPYLDGSFRGVVVEIDSTGSEYLRVVDESDAEWLCNSTGGDPEEVAQGDPCEDCDERVSDGDGYWVGAYEDRMVCESCRENNYTYAFTRLGRRRYIDNDDVVYVDSMDDHYHTDYLSDNNIVCLENGDYAHVDNAVEVDGCWYHCDDDDIVQLVDGSYALVDDCVEINNQWYSKDGDDIVQIDDDWYCKDDDAVVECDDGEYRLKDDCFQCPACDAWHARELIES